MHPQVCLVSSGFLRASLIFTWFRLLDQDVFRSSALSGLSWFGGREDPSFTWKELTVELMTAECWVPSMRQRFWHPVVQILRRHVRPQCSLGRRLNVLSLMTRSTICSSVKLPETDYCIIWSKLVSRLSTFCFLEMNMRHDSSFPKHGREVVSSSPRQNQSPP